MPLSREQMYDCFIKRCGKIQQLFNNNDVDDKQIFEELCCSIYSGDEYEDLTCSVKAEQDYVIRYQYQDGSCFFILDDIIVEVQDLRGMRVSARIGEESYSDICVLTISYINLDNILMSHVVPYSWLYGSTSEYFNEGMPVHKVFIDAAREYISTHKLTKEMQEVHND